MYTLQLFLLIYLQFSILMPKLYIVYFYSFKLMIQSSWLLLNLFIIQIIKNEINPTSKFIITEILRFTHLYFPKSIGQLLHDDLPSLDELAKFLLLLKEKNTLGKPAAFVSGIPTEIVEIFCCHLLYRQNSDQNEIEGADI